MCFVSIPDFLQAFVIDFCDIDTDLEFCFFFLILINLLSDSIFLPFFLKFWKHHSFYGHVLDAFCVSVVTWALESLWGYE